MSEDNAEAKEAEDPGNTSKKNSKQSKSTAVDVLNTEFIYYR